MSQGNPNTVESLHYYVCHLIIVLAFGEALAHIPDVTTRHGLLDIIMVGNMLEFATALGLKSHGRKPPPEVLEEQNVAMWRYRIFQSWFIDRYILEIGGQGVNPSYLFYKLLIQFGTALCSYMKRWEKKAPLTITAQQVIAAVLDHLRKDWQDLLDAFQKLLHDDPSAGHWFSWNGPDFHVFCRDNTQVWTELEDLPDDPIYEQVSDEEQEDSDVGDDRSELGTIRSKRPLSPHDGMCFIIYSSNTGSKYSNQYNR